MQLMKYFSNKMATFYLHNHVHTKFFLNFSKYKCQDIITEIWPSTVDPMWKVLHLFTIFPWYNIIYFHSLELTTLSETKSLWGCLQEGTKLSTTQANITTVLPLPCGEHAKGREPIKHNMSLCPEIMPTRQASSCSGICQAYQHPKT